MAASNPTPARATELQPLPVDGVRAVIVGVGLWLVGLVALLLLRHQLAARGAGWWIWVMAAGAGLGLPGLWFVLRRRAAYRPTVRQTGPS